MEEGSHIVHNAGPTYAKAVTTQGHDAKQHVACNTVCTHALELYIVTQPESVCIEHHDRRGWDKHGG